MTNFNTKYQSVCGIDIAKNVIQIQGLRMNLFVN